MSTHSSVELVSNSNGGAGQIFSWQFHTFLISYSNLSLAGLFYSREMKIRARISNM